MQLFPMDARGRPVVCRRYTLQVGRSRVTSLPSVDSHPLLPVRCARTTVDPSPPLVMPNKVFCPRHCREMARRSYSSAAHRGSCEKRGGSSRVDRVPPSSGGWCGRPRPGVGGYGTAKSTLSPPVNKTHHARLPCGKGKVNIHIHVLIRCAAVNAWHMSVAYHSTALPAHDSRCLAPAADRPP